MKENINMQYMHSWLSSHYCDIEFLPYDYFSEGATLYLQIAEVYKEYNHGMSSTKEVQIIRGILDGKAILNSLYKIKG